MGFLHVDRVGCFGNLGLSASLMESIIKTVSPICRGTGGTSFGLDDRELSSVSPHGGN